MVLITTFEDVCLLRCRADCLIEFHRRFGGSYCLHRQGGHHHVLYHTTQHPRRQSSSNWTP
jgi:hypothetical protein